MPVRHGISYAVPIAVTQRISTNIFASSAVSTEAL